MLNNAEIVLRIQSIMSENELSASAFADRIGVQRSSISHILSGRNKPSLDFLAKVESTFDEVSFSWLLKGEKTTSTNTSSFTPTPIEANHPEKSKKETIETINSPSKIGEPVTIVHYYSDGSFEAFHKR